MRTQRERGRGYKEEKGLVENNNAKQNKRWVKQKPSEDKKESCVRNA